MGTSSSKRRKGRRGGLQEARELIGLLGALSRQGDTVDAKVIAERLGTTTQEAQKLMVLLETVGIDTYTPLSLYSDSEGTLSVAFDDGIHGTALRLTKPETVALNAALNYLQIPSDDPLRLKINKALGNQDVDVEAIKRTIAPAAAAPVEEALRTIATAIANSKVLTFYYKGNADNVVRRREVIPRCVQRNDSSWLLQAYDLQRKADRTFRVDRMSSCNTDTIQTESVGYEGTDTAERPEEGIQGKSHITGFPAEESSQSNSTKPAEVMVTLFIRDPAVLQEFYWPGLQVISEEGDCITATIPYYGDNSPWLPRVLAACGKRIHCSDSHINELVRDYARNQLTLADA